MASSPERFVGTQWEASGICGGLRSSEEVGKAKMIEFGELSNDRRRCGGDDRQVEGMLLLLAPWRGKQAIFFFKTPKQTKQGNRQKPQAEEARAGLEKANK